ncbi:MAG: tyrosine-protein phosphatase [Deltaproteobacteria bacterium]|nr:tyrosine-protein phosphatase [Deltaproteobacteria bacterium]MBW1846067.1 tyrosine-protein phosphatase [Deltaproteobacteria bacterium]MBW2180604.1 tyrosine-protein phosphatase [Deltaproteobacteria bacterium]MBW2363732.1 tyrosine-protein phosphatase [Deltaproteobacteria bacterium]
MIKNKPIIKKVVFVFICIAMGFGLFAGSLFFYWAVLDYRFFTLTEGEVYRSAAMPSKTLLNKIRKHKIRSVIDFRKPDNGVAIEKETLDQVGVRHINLPSKQVPTSENIKTFLLILDNPENKPLLLHCEHGVGRAGAFSAIYRMEYDKWDNERAIHESRQLSGYGSFKKGSNKEVYLRNYTPRWKHSQ